jgi:hypothetical protein
MRNFDEMNAEGAGDREDHSDLMSIGYLIMVVLACIVLSLMAHGCSAIGYGVGSAIQSREKLQSYESAKLWPGTEWDIVLRDGTKIRGIYRGLDSIPTEEYNAAYSQAIDEKRSKGILPHPGDQIEISDLAGNSQSCEFGYFTYSRPDLDAVNPEAQAWLLKADAIPSTKPLYFNLIDIKRLALKNGVETNGEELAALASSGQIPLKTHFIQATLDSVVSVPLQQIRMIESPRRRSAKWIGFGFGLVMDAFIIWGLAHYEGPI